LAALVSSGDYPAEALRRGEQGTVEFRMFIGSDGLPKDCTVFGTSGSVLLDQRTCWIMKRRAKFEPARDQSGNAIASLIVARIRWLLAR